MIHPLSLGYSILSLSIFCIILIDEVLNRWNARSKNKFKRNAYVDTLGVLGHRINSRKIQVKKCKEHCRR